MDNEAKFCQGRRSGEVEDLLAQFFKQFILLFKRLLKKKANVSRSPKLARKAL